MQSTLDVCSVYRCTEKAHDNKYRVLGLPILIYSKIKNRFCGKNKAVSMRKHHDFLLFCAVLSSSRHTENACFSTV